MTVIPFPPEATRQHQRDEFAERAAALGYAEHRVRETIRDYLETAAPYTASAKLWLRSLIEQECR